MLRNCFYMLALSLMTSQAFQTAPVVRNPNTHIRFHTALIANTERPRSHRGIGGFEGLRSKLYGSSRVQKWCLPFRRVVSASASSSELVPTSSSELSDRKDNGKKGTMVYILVLLNVAMFLADKFSPLSLRGLYLNHYHPVWYQLAASTVCHATTQHLSSNMFPLLVFGRLVEDELGGVGLLLAYLICGLCSNLASLYFLPASTLSLGASGAIFGLFTVAVVFGYYVWERLTSEVVVTASGGIVGINHVGHLGGAAAGILLVLCVKLLLAALEPPKRASN